MLTTRQTSKGPVSPPLASTTILASGDTKENGTQRTLVRSFVIGLRDSRSAAQGRHEQTVRLRGARSTQHAAWGHAGHQKSHLALACVVL